MATAGVIETVLDIFYHFPETGEVLRYILVASSIASAQAFSQCLTTDFTPFSLTTEGDVAILAKDLIKYGATKNGTTEYYEFYLFVKFGTELRFYKVRIEGEALQVTLDKQPVSANVPIFFFKPITLAH